MTDLLRAVDATPTGQRRPVDFARGLLVGSRCLDCAWLSWPPRAGCPLCHGVRVEPAALPTQGVLYSWTRVWVPVEGITPPYLLGLVRLAGVRVFGHIRDLPEDATVPTPVQLRVAESSAPPFWFVPGES